MCKSWIGEEGESSRRGKEKGGRRRRGKDEVGERGGRAQEEKNG